MGVPLKGSFLTLAWASLLYVGTATAYGLLISTFVRSDIAIFGAAILTFLPVSQFSGLITPVSSLEGFGALTGRIFPTTYYLLIARGTFSKALGFLPLQQLFVPLVLILVVWLALSAATLPNRRPEPCGSRTSSTWASRSCAALRAIP